MVLIEGGTAQLSHDAFDVRLNLIVCRDQNIQSILLDHLEVLRGINPALIKNTAYGQYIACLVDWASWDLLMLYSVWSEKVVKWSAYQRTR
jgi:hypothetical protein